MGERTSNAALYGLLGNRKREPKQREFDKFRGFRDDPGRSESAMIEALEDRLMRPASADAKDERPPWGPDNRPIY